MHEEVTSFLSAIDQGDPRAAEQHLPLVYDELRKLAAQMLAREKPGQTLQATALVHEAYLRLVGPQDPGWNGRNHFLAAAAEAMRRILVERSRHKRAEKRGGEFHRVDLDGLDLPAVPGGVPAADLVALDEALCRFAAQDPVKAELVKLRYFAGLSVEEAAGVLGISRATAARHWDYARSWLYSELHGRGPEEESPKKPPQA
jgi:RNA polymerase sigma factor (TIGR02999 family)